jgi:transcription termination factor Rho
MTTKLTRKTKKEFLENAAANGLAMLGTTKKSLEEITKFIEEIKIPYNGSRDDCSYCGQTLKRKFIRDGQEITSHLHLTRNELIYYHPLGYWIVNTIIPEKSQAQPRFENNIIYA